MQKTMLEYLSRPLPLLVEDGNLLGVCGPNDYHAEGKDGDVAYSLSHPVSGPSLDGFLIGASSAIVILNDATRPTPSPRMLESILPVLESRHLKVALLVATGAHRVATEEEYRQILGGFYGKYRSSCTSHDAKEKESLVEIGVTRNGTPIILDKKVFQYDRIIVTGSVEPHYFAGFTGGRKAFLPGVAGYETIVANHKLALSDAAHSLALEGNPVHQDMIDALTHIKAPVFSVMAVMDRVHQVASVCSGGINEAFEKAVEVAKKIFCVRIPQKADIVVSVATFPMDINLYQSQKAIDNGGLAVKDGGSLILVSACRDGIGDKGFADLLSGSSTPDEAFGKIREGYRLGYHKAAKMIGVFRHCDVYALTGLDDALLEGMFMKPIHNLQRCVDGEIAKAKARGVENPTVLILPDGCVTVPLIG